MKKTKLTRTLLAACSIVALSAVMYGCVHSSDDPAPPPVTEPDPEPEPTAYEAGKAAIMAATTAEAAQAAYDAVDQTAISGAEATSLSMALATKLDMLATMARETEQKMALMTAAGMIDTSDLSTQELVDAARSAIAGLRQALDDAADVSDADKAMYQTQLTNAVDAVDTAQGGIDTATRRMNQMDALSSASMALQTALAALSGSTPTQAQLDAANNALTALNAAITGGADLTDTEKAPYQREANNAAAPISMAQKAFDDAEDDAEKTKNEMMAATAAKLYAGIDAPMGDPNSPAATDRAAAYNDAGTPTGAAVDAHILVTIGDGTNTPTAIVLSEDKKTTVAANHGWAGKRYADPAGDDEYEAFVYSNVEDPTEGDKFGQVGVTTPVTGYQYGLSATGQIDVNTSTTAAYVDLIDSSNFDQSAGVKRFPLPDPNPGQATVVSVAGTFHGVSGTYTCTPGATVCAANVSGDGFQLGTVPSATDATFTDGGGTWMFKPSNPEARVMEAADMAYASYGWWIKKAEHDGPFTASAFVDVKGAVADAAGLDALNGTATYKGGAAGKYALSSSTGGTNDAGHFTARATLEADFTNNTDSMAITGTIDMFMGADGMSRDWEVALKGSAIANTGGIGNDGTSATSPGGTIWTIGEDAADAAGSWTGALRNNGADGVPQVATGTFYSTYGTAGKMVGAFGANKEE